MPDIDTVLSWRGRQVVDISGEKIGTLEEIYLDAETDRPEWGGVRSGLVRRREHLVPLGEATEAEDAIQVPWEREQVENAPDADPSEELTEDEEAALFAHYGITRGEDRVAGAGDAHAVTRSEEEVVDTGRREVRPRERVRLKKYLVTEHVKKTVPVQREVVEVEEEPTEPDG